MDRHKVISARFYATSSGRMPVREWLLSLAKEDRIEIGGDIANVEYHWPVGPPKCKALGNGLFEIRSRISDNGQEQKKRNGGISDAQKKTYRPGL